MGLIQVHYNPCPFPKASCMSGTCSSDVYMCPHLILMYILLLATLYRQESQGSEELTSPSPLNLLEVARIWTQISLNPKPFSFPQYHPSITYYSFPLWSNHPNLWPPRTWRKISRNWCGKLIATIECPQHLLLGGISGPIFQRKNYKLGQHIQNWIPWKYNTQQDVTRSSLPKKKKRSVGK